VGDASRRFNSFSRLEVPPIITVHALDANHYPEATRCFVSLPHHLTSYLGSLSRLFLMQQHRVALAVELESNAGPGASRKIRLQFPLEPQGSSVSQLINHARVVSHYIDWAAYLSGAVYGLYDSRQYVQTRSSTSAGRTS